MNNVGTILSSPFFLIKPKIIVHSSLNNSVIVKYY